MRTVLLKYLFLLAVLCISFSVEAQDIQAKVNVTHEKVQGVSDDFFRELGNKMQDFLNKRQWSDRQYRLHERVHVNMTLSVSEYNPDEHHIKSTLHFQVLRPVFNATYKTVSYAFEDPLFDFSYEEFAPLEFRLDAIDNSLSALLAYYAYWALAIDGDTMAKYGGTDFMNKCRQIAEGAQQLSEKGWEAFGNEQSRYAIVNSYLNERMKSFRDLQYVYYRLGLDKMAENADRGRGEVVRALQMLKKSKEENSLSPLPVLFTDYKSGELVGIFSDRGSEEEKKEVYELLRDLNPSKNYEWRKIIQQ